MAQTYYPRSVLITGAGGNLGRKVIEWLARTEWCRSIIGLDVTTDVGPFSPGASARLKLVAGDLLQANSGWQDAFRGVDAVIHFAAQNPHTDASWEDAVASFDMTFNVAASAEKAGVHRIVFASSNHVMGGYKDFPLAGTMGPGHLTTSIAPAPGTKWSTGHGFMDSTAYAVSKLMCERLCVDMAAQSEGRLTAVAVRIGWTQPGENLARTINLAGDPKYGVGPEPTDEEGKRDLRWYRNMWLSNDDLGRLFEAAVTADASRWPAPGIVVNGMSANEGMDWDIKQTEQLLGYKAQQNIYAELRAGSAAHA
ncbi:NAD-dependent dehydratase [Microvirga sp. KLBC 81]|uniref:NAD-dependent epimerase/dehydratase family protein n=1 Tax=Microvirga sp. KLBC 81 TaxID=1862707 RepID=UPI000D5147B6|nr:NAD(P)-dependent oxidoreductase [Microvirga sp. KLBC 81]PVE23625.1 NAD-dependent dehydratase [Microvirga sp. KLBC 81]